LQIRERLEGDGDIELVVLPEAERKVFSRRLEAMGGADVSILCLPDDAAREIAAAALSEVKIIDASTAHRTLLGWDYGFPELRVAAPGVNAGARRRDLIRQSRRVANPGCHATGFLALAVPLLQGGFIPPDIRLHCHSLTGYSGGGKSMIAAYEDPRRPQDYASPRQYGLGLQHKHLPEMHIIAGLEKPPLFCPIVDNFYKGMLVSITLGAEEFRGLGAGSVEKLRDIFADYYRDEPLIHVMEGAPEDGTLASNSLAGRDDLEIWIAGNPEQALLMARFDNLGKGASGAAVQSLNLMLDRPESAGLKLIERMYPHGENHGI
jgi:N-acetyl-gamma-glutamyl-phosphate reductase